MNILEDFRYHIACAGSLLGIALAKRIQQSLRWYYPPAKAFGLVLLS